MPTSSNKDNHTILDKLAKTGGGSPLTSNSLHDIPNPFHKTEKHKHKKKHDKTTATKTATHVHKRLKNSPYQPFNLKHNQLPTPSQETSEDTYNHNWQRSPHKHIMNNTRRDTHYQTLKSPPQTNIHQ